jgi:copper chaperone CopZ
VNDLRDSSDISNIRGELQSMDGVHAVRVDNLSNTITVEYEDNLTPEKLTSAINKYRKGSNKEY